MIQKMICQIILGRRCDSTYQEMFSFSQRYDMIGRAVRSWQNISIVLFFVKIIQILPDNHGTEKGILPPTLRPQLSIIPSLSFLGSKLGVPFLYALFGASKRPVLFFTFVVFRRLEIKWTGAQWMLSPYALSRFNGVSTIGSSAERVGSSRELTYDAWTCWFNRA